MAGVKRKRMSTARSYPPKRKYARKEKTPFGDVGSKIGQKVGGFFGISQAGKIGGRLLGTGIGRLLFGSGDYNGNLDAVRVNSIINPQSTPMIAAGYESAANGDSVIIRRTEYIKDIVSSATANTFTSETFPLNPGQPATFPFLSKIAQNYEEYKLLGMCFHFKSLSGDSVASVQSGLGFVAMATQYDSMDAPFTNKNQIVNYSMSQSGNPSKDQLHGIECADHLVAQSHLYVRPSNQPANTDLRLYDLGTTTIANSCPGTSVTLGELWVTYEVMLMKPKISEIDTTANAVMRITRTNTSTTLVNAGSIGILVEGTLVPTVNNATTLTFPTEIGRRYIITMYWVGGIGGLTRAAATNVTLVGSTLTQTYPNTLGVIGSNSQLSGTHESVNSCTQLQVTSIATATSTTLTYPTWSYSSSATWGFQCTIAEVEL